MEFERRHWWRNSVPTGYRSMKAHTFRSKAIHESEYGNLEKMKADGMSNEKIGQIMGCSAHSVKTTLQHIAKSKQ